MIPSELQRAFDTAKMELMESKDTIFYTSVFFSLNHVWDESVKTACTDGISVKFAPSYFMKCSPQERLGLILHETEHVTGMDMLRKGDRDHTKWNIACDYCIDTGLTDRGFKIPDVMYNRDYRNLSKEEIYDQLPKDPPSNYKPDILMPDGGIPGDGTDTVQGSQAQALQEHINEILIRAAMQVTAAGANPGQIPGHIQVHLDKLLNPKLPWYRLLARHCHHLTKTDYSFRKPNRRYFPDYILPSQHGEGMGRIAVMMDMSGSLTDAQSTHFASETYGIVKRLKPKVLELAQFDTSIRSVTPIKSVQDLKRVTYHGRGGTDIKPVIDWIAKEKPDVAVIFTDGYFRSYTFNPKVPVIWVIHNNRSFTAPYGKVVHYDMPSG